MMSRMFSIARRRASQVVCGLTLIVMPCVAWAQAPPPAQQPRQPGQQPGQQPQQGTPTEDSPSMRRPYAGLFGAGERGGNAHRIIDFTASAVGGYDDDVIGTAQGGGGGSTGSAVPIAGNYGETNATLDFRQRRDRSSFNASVGGDLRYYPDLTETTGSSGFGNFNLDTRLGRRTTFSLTGDVTYSQYYRLGAFPGLSEEQRLADVAAQSGNFTLLQQPILSTTAGVSLARQLSRKSDFRVFYTGTLTDSVGEGTVDATQASNLLDQTVGAGYTSRVSRYWSWNAGYSYRDGQSGTFSGIGTDLTGHNLDLGVGFARALGRTQRTRISVTTGTGVLLEEEQHEFVLNVDAYISREFSRFWNARLGYVRGVQFVYGFEQPFESDTVSARLSGYLTRRWDVQATTAYSRGDVGLSGGTGQSFNTLTASLGTRFAVSRSLAFNADYFFYSYDFGDQVVLPGSLARDVTRNGLRAGLTVWFGTQR